MKSSTKREDINKKDKTAERAFVQNFIISIICALVCITALSASTWAWFRQGVSSDTQIFEIANCDIEIVVAHGTTGDVILPEEYPDGGKYKLEKGNTYIVTLKGTGTATTCYCKLLVGSEDNEYYTEQITMSYDELTGQNVGKISFTLSFDADTYVYILSRWGTGSMTDRKFKNGGVYNNTDFPELSVIVADEETETESKTEEQAPASEAESETEATESETMTAESETEALESEPLPETETETESESAEVEAEPEIEAESESNEPQSEPSSEEEPEA